uniref:Uncharacterized protein n=1 Tax=Opuntia streptacantha TaxID=393608 RepID=A0A7C8YPZ7_OPUST
MSLLIVSEFGHCWVCRNQSRFAHLDGFVQQFKVSVFWFPWKTIFINRSIIVITSGDKTSGCVFKICSSVKHVIVHIRTAILDESCYYISNIFCRSVRNGTTPLCVPAGPVFSPHLRF